MIEPYAWLTMGHMKATKWSKREGAQLAPVQTLGPKRLADGSVSMRLVSESVSGMSWVKIEMSREEARELGLKFMEASNEEPTSLPPAQEPSETLL